ncbi:MAG: cyclic nucleotide-binding domain-containing protein, partial [Xanthobacteraceae bacterium]
HYEPGDIVIRQGDEGDELFLISEGEVEVEREGHEVARLGPAEFFGESALISGEPRNATVVATTPLDTYVLEKDEFRAAVEQSASFRDQLHRVYFLRH